MFIKIREKKKKFKIFLFAYCIASQTKNRMPSHTLKLNKLIWSSEPGVIFFSTQLLLKISLFEINNRFVLHRTWAVYNRYPNCFTSFMIFWGVPTPLDHLSIHFSLFRLDKYFHSRALSPLYFCSFAEDRRASCIPLQPWSLWA